MSTPGTVVGHSINGQRKIVAKGFRSALDVSEPLEMQVDTGFDLASLTKIVATTASIMELVVENHMNIDDRVATYLPLWGSSEKNEITVRHLLTHRSGLAEWRPLYISAAEANQAHELIATTPLSYGIDRERHYSDLGFITLGRVITAITQVSLLESFQKLSFDNASFNSTQFSVPKDISNVAATSRGDRFEKNMIQSQTPYLVVEKAEDFKYWRTNILSGEVNDGNAFHLFKGTSSHAGLFSNAEDLLLFGELFLENPALSGFIADTSDTDFHCGFRSWVDTCGPCTTRFYGHTGFTGVVLAFSPQHSSVITVLSNRLHTDGELLTTESIFLPYLKDFHAQLHA